MKRLSANETRRAMTQSESMLMVTFSHEATSYALTNGVGVTAKAARELTAQCDLPGIPSGPEPLVPNDDGLFPGFSQTWRAQ